LADQQGRKDPPPVGIGERVSERAEIQPADETNQRVRRDREQSQVEQRLPRHTAHIGELLGLRAERGCRVGADRIEVDVLMA